MKTHFGEKAENKNQGVGNTIAQKNSVGKAGFQFEDKRPEAIGQNRLSNLFNNSQNVTQLKERQEIEYKQELLETSEPNPSVVQKIGDDNFNKIKSIVDSYSAKQELISNVENPEVFNAKISSLKAFKNLNDSEKERVKSQVKMKIKHQNLPSIQPEDANDIEKSFNPLKSCVITALLYAEGGSVLGVSNVSDLHQLFYVQFPKWRQYSDDNVLVQIYHEFGYQSATVAAQSRQLLVTTQNKVRGMTASTGDIGHMVGFKKVDNSYMLKDNDHGEAGIGQHATKLDQVNKIWWK
jgi:hypothetical protein